MLSCAELKQAKPKPYKKHGYETLIATGPVKNVHAKKYKSKDLDKNIVSQDYSCAISWYSNFRKSPFDATTTNRNEEHHSSNEPQCSLNKLL